MDPAVQAAHERLLAGVDSRFRPSPCFYCTAIRFLLDVRHPDAAVCRDCGAWCMEEDDTSVVATT
jgi:hypothetical protein